jgi:hypothetical protein
MKKHIESSTRSQSVNYRVPYKIQADGAMNKARVAYYLLRRPPRSQSDIVPEPDSHVVDFEAPSHAAAARLLASVILPDDPRPVRAASWVKHFAIGG